MSFRSEDFQRLLDAFETERDISLLGVIADFLEEEGQPSCIAWQWLARWDRKPNEEIVYGRPQFRFVVAEEFKEDKSDWILGMVPPTTSIFSFNKDLRYQYAFSTSFLRVYVEAVRRILEFDYQHGLPW